MTKKSTMVALAAVMFTASALGFSGVTFAESARAASSWKSSQNTIKNYLKNAPGVMGKVTAINGNTITVNSKNNTMYTIDATTAQVVKNRNTIITLSDVKIGDTIMAKGTVDGTTVTASSIFDGKVASYKGGRGKHKGQLKNKQ